jgi:hypothetical protein
VNSTDRTPRTTVHHYIRLLDFLLFIWCACSETVACEATLWLQCFVMYGDTSRPDTQDQSKPAYIPLLHQVLASPSLPVCIASSPHKRVWCLQWIGDRQTRPKQRQHDIPLHTMALWDVHMLFVLCFNPSPRLPSAVFGAKRMQLSMQSALGMNTRNNLPTSDSCMILEQQINSSSNLTQSACYVLRNALHVKSSSGCGMAAIAEDH